MTTITQEAVDRTAEGGSGAAVLQVGRELVARFWFFVIVAGALIPILYVPIQTGNNFLSDDMSMYWTARQFGETGKLYFEDDLTRDDAENLLHARGFVTSNGRVVPYNFLGLPVLYGAAYAVVGEKAEYVGAGLAIGALAAIWGILGILHPRQDRVWAFALVFLAFPVLYYFGRPYMNIVPALAFFLMGFYLLLRHYQEPDPWRMAGASAVFALGIFCRYPDIVFVTPLALIVLWQRYESLLSRQLWRDVGIYVGVVAIVFGLPLLVFNQLTYGSPLTYGYSLFNDAYDPGRGGSAAPGLLGILGTIGVWVMPGGFDLWSLAGSIRKYFFVLTPALPVLAGIGFYLISERQLIKTRYLVAYAILGGYIIIYAGSGAVWGTQFDAPTLGHTMVRYWLLAYLMLALAATYAVLHSPSWVPRLSIVGVAVLLAYTSLFVGSDSLPKVKDGIERGQRWAEQSILPYTEENAIIYTGRSDKKVMGNRRVAGWFNSADDSFFDPTAVASSMNRLRLKDVPVYIVNEPDADLQALASELRKYRLDLNRTGRGDLYEVVALRENIGQSLESR